MSIQTPQTHDNSRIATKTLELANSLVELESGPAGTIARVEHADGRTDYAGPLDEHTVVALREVGR